MGGESFELAAAGVETAAARGLAPAVKMADQNEKVGQAVFVAAGSSVSTKAR